MRSPLAVFPIEFEQVDIVTNAPDGDNYVIGSGIVIEIFPAWQDGRARRIARVLLDQGGETTALAGNLRVSGHKQPLEGDGNEYLEQ